MDNDLAESIERVGPDSVSLLLARETGILVTPVTTRKVQWLLQALCKHMPFLNIDTSEN